MNVRVEIPIDRDKIYKSEYIDSDVIEVDLKKHLSMISSQVSDFELEEYHKILISEFLEAVEPEEMIQAMNRIFKEFFSQVEFDSGDLDKDILKLAHKTLKQMDF